MPPLSSSPRSRDAQQSQQHPLPENFDQRNANSGRRSISSRSDTSIADVEAGFLPGIDGERKRWYTGLWSTIFIHRRRPSSNSSLDCERSLKWRPKASSWVISALIAILLGMYVILLLFDSQISMIDQWVTGKLTVNSVLAFILVQKLRHPSYPCSGVQLITSRWGLPDPSSQEALVRWPTNFSRDITPIPCHSHNDYWRKVPLYDALAAGCTGVEADVWLDNKDLLVGHDSKSLTTARTLKSLYIDPLLTILNNQNVASILGNSTANNSSSPNGIFDTNPSTSVVLLIDIKTDEEITFPAVLEALNPLFQANYLTTWSPSAGLIERPITVVATGNTKFASIQSPRNLNPRTIFFDAPLSSLASDPDSVKYDTTNSHYASVSFAQEIGSLFMTQMSAEQVMKVQTQVKAATDRGLKARYWDTPAWPIRARGNIWNTLVMEGVGMLNVDDLEGASKGSWAVNGNPWPGTRGR